MSLPASTKIFTGTGQSGNWADPANWQGGVAAKSTSIVLIPTNAVLNGSFAVRQLMILGQESVTINGVLTTLGPGLCDSFMICANAVTTFTAGSSLADHGGLVVGNISTGTLIAQAGSTLVTVSTKIGKAADGTGTMTVDGAQWHNSTTLFVGLSGHGTLTVTNGGQAIIGTSLDDGDLPGAVGHVSLSNGGTMHIGTYAKIGGGNPGVSGGTGTLSVGAGSLLTVAGRLNITSSGSVALSGGTVSSTDPAHAIEVWAKGSVTGFGTLAAPKGTIDNGTITATGGTLTLNGPLTGAGTGALDIAANSTAVLNAATIGKVTIAFTGSDATLALNHGVSSMATISGFNATDHITMAGVDQFAWNAKTGMLTLSEDNKVVDTLHFAGAYTSDQFTLSQPSAGALMTIGLTH